MSIIQNFFQDTQSCYPSSLPWMEHCKFTLITSMDQLTKELDQAIKQGLCSLDLETQGLDNRIDDYGRTMHQIVGYCFSYNDTEGFYVPVRHVNAAGVPSKSNLPYLKVDEEIKRLCSHCVCIYHNSSFDQEFLFGSSAHIDDPSTGQFEDTLILDYIKDSTSKMHGLKHLSKKYLDMEMHELKEFYPKKIKDRNFAKLDPNHPAVLRYAGADAICTFKLYQHLMKYEDEQPTIYKIEKALVPALRWTERNRMKVDLKYAKNLQREVEVMIEETQEALYASLAESLGKTVDEAQNAYDINSPKQLGDALTALQHHDRAFGRIELERTGKSDQISTAGDAIEKLASEHGHRFPFIAKIQTMRSLQKVLNTYIKPLVDNTRREDSTTRFSFQANRVDTGRFAASKGKQGHGYSGLNVQSIPGTASYTKIYVKKVHSRPVGAPGDSPDLEDTLTSALSKGFMRRIYDDQFMQDHRSGEELCVRKSCQGCPFFDDCTHEDPIKQRFYSVENAVRPALVASEGCVLVSCDYSGVELRVVANLCEEPKWIEQFYKCGSCDHQFEMPESLGKGNWKILETPPVLCPTCGSDKIGDLHTLTAQIIYGEDVVNLPPSEFKQKRGVSKGVNFAIVYGGGGGAIARTTGVTSTEGWEIRNKYLNGLPEFKKWMERTIASAHKNLEVETAFGRKIRLWDINSEEKWLRAKQERNAVNSIVQGTATGDLIKYAMAAIYGEVKKRGWLEICKLCLTMHDELVFEIRQDMLDEVLPVINHCMTKPAYDMKWAIPLVTDVEFNTNWSPNYNWTLMHAVSKMKGIAEEGVPLFLIGQIKMSPGMWYEDEKGRQHIWNGTEYMSKEDFKTDNTSPTTPALPSLLSVVEEKEAAKPKEAPAQVERFPVYEYKTHASLSGREDLASYMLRLRRVVEACKVLSRLGKAKPTHTLRVYTVQKDELTDPKKVVEVDVSIFNALAFYEGL